MTATVIGRPLERGVRLDRRGDGAKVKRRPGSGGTPGAPATPGSRRATPTKVSGAPSKATSVRPASLNQRLTTGRRSSSPPRRPRVQITVPPGANSDVTAPTV